MKTAATAFGLVLLIAPAAELQAGGVQLTISNGRVWLSATDATVAQILAEWSRVGGTHIVNADRVPGGPLTLQLSDVSEQQALDLILRSAGGFVAMGRPATSTMASRFAQVLIMPVGAPVQPAARVVAAPPLVPAPVAPPDVPAVSLPSGVRPVIGPDGQPIPDDQEGAPGAARPRQQPFTSMPPGFSPESGAPANAAPASQPPASAPAQGPPPNSKTPSPAAGTSVPGMIVPAPARQPGR